MIRDRYYFLTAAVGGFVIFLVCSMLYVKAGELGADRSALFFAPPLAVFICAGVMLRFPRFGGIVMAIAALWFGSLNNWSWAPYGGAVLALAGEMFGGAVLVGQMVVTLLWTSALLAFHGNRLRGCGIRIFSSVLAVFGLTLIVNMAAGLAAAYSLEPPAFYPTGALYSLGFAVVMFAVAGVVLLWPLIGGVIMAITAVWIAYAFGLGALGLVVLAPLWIGALLAFLEYGRLARSNPRSCPPAPSS